MYVKFFHRNLNIVKIMLGKRVNLSIKSTHLVERPNAHYAIVHENIKKCNETKFWILF